MVKTPERRQIKYAKYFGEIPFLELPMISSLQELIIHRIYLGYLTFHILTTIFDYSSHDGNNQQ